MVLLAAGCFAGGESPAEEPSPTEAVAIEESVHADVTAVSATGEAGAYTFDATVRSPDTGCNSYADWWEVVSPNGELLYRRVLLHSHVDEQPFTRSGGRYRLAPTTRSDGIWAEPADHPLFQRRKEKIYVLVRDTLTLPA